MQFAFLFFAEYNKMLIKNKYQYLCFITKKLNKKQIINNKQIILINKKKTILEEYKRNMQYKL